MGIGGQQVVGVVDALHEAVGAQYPDDACTQVFSSKFRHHLCKQKLKETNKLNTDR